MLTNDKFKNPLTVSKTVYTEGVGLSPIQLQKVFPYHIAIDSSFLIIQIGSNLSALFQKDSFLIGKHLSNCFDLITPNNCSWNWNDVIENANSHFEMNMKASIMNKFLRRELKNINLRGDVLIQSTAAIKEAIFLLHLNISNANELSSSGYKISDIPMYNMQKDLLLVGDHLQSEFTSSRQFQKQFSQDLKVRTLELESAKVKSILDSKKAFIRYISHELRNPLNISLLGLNLLEEQLNDSNKFQTQSSNLLNLVSFTNIDKNTLLELISDVKNSNIIATEVLNDLLLYEKIDNNELNLDMTEIKPSVIIKNVVKLFKSQARQSNIHLELTEAGNLDQVHIQADISKLSQVLRNILSNAIKFTPNGGQISVSSELIISTSSSSPSSCFLPSSSFGTTTNYDSKKMTPRSKQSSSSSSKLQVLTEKEEGVASTTTGVTSCGKNSMNNTIVKGSNNSGKKTHFATDHVCASTACSIPDNNDDNNSSNNSNSDSRNSTYDSSNSNSSKTSHLFTTVGFMTTTSTATTATTTTTTDVITTSSNDIVTHNNSTDSLDTETADATSAHSPHSHSTTTRTDVELTSPFTSFCVSPVFSNNQSKCHSISRTVSQSNSHSPPLSKSPSIVSNNSCNHIDSNSMNNMKTNMENIATTTTITTTASTKNNLSSSSSSFAAGAVGIYDDRLLRPHNQNEKNHHTVNNNKNSTSSSCNSGTNSKKASTAMKSYHDNNDDTDVDTFSSSAATPVVNENKSSKGRARKRGSDRARARGCHLHNQHMTSNHDSNYIDNIGSTVNSVSSTSTITSILISSITATTTRSTTATTSTAISKPMACMIEPVLLEFSAEQQSTDSNKVKSKHPIISSIGEGIHDNHNNSSNDNHHHHHHHNSGNHHHHDHNHNINENSFKSFPALDSTKQQQSPSQQSQQQQWNHHLSFLLSSLTNRANNVFKKSSSSSSLASLNSIQSVDGSHSIMNSNGSCNSTADIIDNNNNNDDDEERKKLDNESKEGCSSKKNCYNNNSNSRKTGSKSERIVSSSSSSSSSLLVLPSSVGSLSMLSPLLSPTANVLPLLPSTSSSSLPSSSVVAVTGSTHLSKPAVMIPRLILPSIIPSPHHPSSSSFLKQKQPIIMSNDIHSSPPSSSSSFPCSPSDITVVAPIDNNFINNNNNHPYNNDSAKMNAFIHAIAIDVNNCKDNNDNDDDIDTGDDDDDDVFDCFNTDDQNLNSSTHTTHDHYPSYSQTHHSSTSASTTTCCHTANDGNYFPSPHNSPRTLGYLNNGNSGYNNNYGGGASCRSSSSKSTSHMISNKSSKTHVSHVSNHNHNENNNHNSNSSSKTSKSPPDILRIYVKDTGIGLSKATQKALFEEFSNCRTTSSLSGKHAKTNHNNSNTNNDSILSKNQSSTKQSIKHGSGLGLWVARSIMEAHRGTIGVFSEGENMGQGSVFYIDIPISRIDSSLLDDSLNMSFSSKSSKNVSNKSYCSNNDDPYGNGGQSSSSSLTNAPSLFPTNFSTNSQSSRSLFSSLSPRCLQSVLVVDDSKTNRKMLVRLLQGKKIGHIEEAVDGADAIEKYKNSISGADGAFPYDVIMMDFVMPVMDGPTSTQQLRSLGYKGLIVGVTGNSLPSDVELFLESGANKVMIKPLDINKFMTYASCWIQRCV